MNKLAKDVCEIEEGKCQVNIAQTKEIIKCTMQLLGNHRCSEIMEVVERYE